MEGKQELEHGQFQHWLKAEFDMSYLNKQDKKGCCYECCSREGR